MAVGQREPSPVLPPLEEGRRPAGRDPFIGRRHPDARRRVRPTDPNDPQYYWLDPEDEVSQDDYHQRTILALYYLFLAPLKKVHPDLWVRADLPAAYRFTDGRGRVQTKVMAPDVMVGEGPEPDRGGSYHSWEHGQLLFAVEVASPKTERHDLGTKLKQYGVQLRPKEILCYNPRTNVLRLYRWNGTEYELVFNERWVPGKWVRVQSQA
ncbi:MAG: Uma2 family endonuclease, partial [Armatimonadetes bacterium]|nr:Uma2 family endonuclease [Armatimonadota bacterium]